MQEKTWIKFTLARKKVFTEKLFTFRKNDATIELKKGGDTMRQFFLEIKSFWRKGDLILLLLCVLTSAFGCLMVASTKNYAGSTRFVIIQALAVVLGIFLYILVSSINADFIAEHRIWLVIFNTAMLSLLLTPWATDYGSNNYSWVELPFLPFAIQPAEFCKITFVIILASVMASHQNRPSHIRSVLHMLLHLALVAGVNLVISQDFGVSMIFVVTFAIMAFAGGVHWGWFALAGGAFAAASPFLWSMLTQRQKNRILILFDPTVDPLGLDERYHAVQSQLSLNAGGLTGQGLFNGNRTQSGALFAQHTDFVFSAIGEEMGYLGCLLVLVLLGAIIFRCIQVGNRTQDYLRRMLCYGVASVLIFQSLINIGMCMGVAPIVGLTLPFISYGGSSVASLFALMGIVSGVHARPAPQSHERYIHPPLYSL